MGTFFPILYLKNHKLNNYCIKSLRYIFLNTNQWHAVDYVIGLQNINLFIFKRLAIYFLGFQNSKKTRYLEIFNPRKMDIDYKNLVENLFLFYLKELVFNPKTILTFNQIHMVALQCTLVKHHYNIVCCLPF